MKYFYKGKIYEMIDYHDDTETNQENNELIKLGLIFGHPIYNGVGVEVEYKGSKIIITPSNFNRLLNPTEKNKKKRQYQKVPAYTITVGNQGGSVEKSKAMPLLRNLKAKLDKAGTKGVLEEGFFTSLLQAGSDVALKGMGFGEIPGQSSDALAKREVEDNANRK